MESEKITIEIKNMKGRDILDKFTKRWESEFKVCPKYIDGNFMILYYWIREKKGFNRNPKFMRIEFWKDLEGIAKENPDKIYYKSGNYSSGDLNLLK